MSAFAQGLSIGGGSITGPGKLIAIGGSGTFGNGGSGTFGNGGSAVTGRRLSQNGGWFPRRGLECADAAVHGRAVPGSAQGKAELIAAKQPIPAAVQLSNLHAAPGLNQQKSTVPAAFG